MSYFESLANLISNRVKRAYLMSNIEIFGPHGLVPVPLLLHGLPFHFRGAGVCLRSVSSALAGTRAVESTQAPCSFLLACPGLFRSRHPRSPSPHSQPSSQVPNVPARQHTPRRLPPLSARFAQPSLPVQPRPRLPDCHGAPGQQLGQLLARTWNGEGAYA